MGSIGAPLFFIYLWITFGIGIRYGGRYLLFSAFLNFISFSAVIFYSSYWSSYAVLPFSIGLLFSFIILPFYVFILISRLSKALQSEKIANEVKQKYLANINHEVRTPLNSVLNIIDLMCLESLPEVYLKILRNVKSSTVTLLNTINSILDISWIEANKFNLEHKVFNIYTLIFDVINILEPQMIDGNIKFSVHIDSKCNPFYVGLYNQLKQVLINFLANAIKYSKNGNITIKLLLVRNNNESQDVLIKIIDTGLGIEKNKIRRILEPFTKASNASSKLYQGSGLGLSIADDFIKIMGGSLHLKSKVNVGTTVSVSLNLKSGNNQEYFAPSLVNIYVFESIATKGLNKVLIEIGVNVILINELCINKLKILPSPYDYLLISNTEIIKLMDNKLDVLDKFRYKLISINDNHNGIMNSLTSVDINSNIKQLKNAIQICHDFNSKDFQQIKQLDEVEKCLNILIVEDDEVTLLLYEKYFSTVKHNVDIESESSSAYQKILNNNYDVVILDLFLQNALSNDLVLKYKKNNPNAKVKFILLTADVSLKAVSNKNIYDKVLTKPIASTDLLIEVYELLKIQYRINISDNEQKQGINSYFNSNFRLKKDAQAFEKNITIAGVNEYKNIFNKFKKEMDENIHIISELKLSNNIHEMKKLMHKIKGASLMFGANELVEMTDEFISKFTIENYVIESNIDAKINEAYIDTVK